MTMVCLNALNASYTADADHPLRLRGLNRITTIYRE